MAMNDGMDAGRCQAWKDLVQLLPDTIVELFFRKGTTREAQRSVRLPEYAPGFRIIYHRREMKSKVAVSDVFSTF